jgi:hypothetical protein
MVNGLNWDVFKETEKIQSLFILIPLLAFIYYKVNFIITIGYTISISILFLYVRILQVFKKNATNTFLYRKEKSTKELFYIPYVWLFILVIIINIIAFIYSLVLSILNFNTQDVYSLSLFIAHIFILTFQIFILIFLEYFRKIINKSNAKPKNKIQRN